MAWALPSGASSWGDGASAISCGWSVPSVALGRVSTMHHWEMGGSVVASVWHDRSGLAADPGCGLDSSWFLPEILLLARGAAGLGAYTSYSVRPSTVIYGGQRWYALDTTVTTGAWRTSTSGTSSRPSFGYVARWASNSAGGSTGFLVTDGGDMRIVRP